MRLCVVRKALAGRLLLLLQQQERPVLHFALTGNGVNWVRLHIHALRGSMQAVAMLWLLVWTGSLQRTHEQQQVTRVTT